ncbi:MAG TPA: type II toxin-antitoxin system HicA family toxin [Dehalococcoidia bacterium]|nr:type II toxin-antitoxin system HicA family toxin [Dehalococcoidia bacterium]
MPPLPRVSGRDTVAALQKAGFSIRRQRGSHIILEKPGTLSVPNHRELKPGTLRALIRVSGLTVDKFVALLS